MTDYLRIRNINETVETYFGKNPEKDRVRAKDLMHLFLKAGIYASNSSDGLPLRDDLRKWDRENRLGALKCLLVDRNEKNRNWWFVRPENESEITQASELESPDENTSE